MGKGLLALKARYDYLLELVADRGYKKGAEIGLWYGKTFFYLLENVPGLTLYGIDIWTACDASHDRDQGGNRYIVYTEAGKYAGAKILEIESMQAMKAFHPASLDFVFIDADHTQKAVKDDILAWKNIVRPGGILCGDDYDMESVKSVVDELVSEAHIEGGFFWWKEI